jgi:formylglycine-generating enzyme required for sulfatase activity
MYYILLEQSATMRDVESLKLQASLSENSGNFELAEQIWIRVLGVSPADSDAVSAIQRIAIKNNNSTPETIPQPIVNYKSPGSSRGEDTMSQTQILEPAENIKENNANSSRIGKEIFLDLIKNRRQFLIYIGLGGTGLLTAFGLKEIFKITTIPKPELLTFKVKTVDKTGKIVNQENHQAKYFKEDLGNNITLEMVQIPGGSFMMGSPESEKDRSTDGSESPQHEVNVPGFSMGKYVVTQAQYQQIMGNNPSGFSGAERPVEKVSWNDAVDFCEKLRQKTGREYRLPSEAEWEYACRAGTTTPFHFGETITTELANYNGTDPYASEPKGKYRQETTNVDIFSPNAFGLYNMHGNVWEWCQDDWHNNYIDAPKDGSGWTSRSGNTKLLRGGSWHYDPGYCRSASRLNDYLVNRNLNIGFRVVCSGAART